MACAGAGGGVPGQPVGEDRWAPGQVVWLALVPLAGEGDRGGAGESLSVGGSGSGAPGRRAGSDGFFSGGIITLSLTRIVFSALARSASPSLENAPFSDEILISPNCWMSGVSGPIAVFTVKEKDAIRNLLRATGLVPPSERDYSVFFEKRQPKRGENKTFWLFCSCLMRPTDACRRRSRRRVMIGDSLLSGGGMWNTRMRRG